MTLEERVKVLVGKGLTTRALSARWFALIMQELRAYGDERERAGIERAANVCAFEAMTLPADEWDLDEVAKEIRALPVPAQSANNAKEASDADRT